MLQTFTWGLSWRVNYCLTRLAVAELQMSQHSHLCIDSSIHRDGYCWADMGVWWSHYTILLTSGDAFLGYIW